MIVRQTQSFLSQSAVPNPLLSARLARPRHPALECGATTWSSDDLLLGVARVAGRLAAAGVRPGDHVALCGPASPSWIIALHAIGWVGATAVPLPPNATRDELQRRVELAGVDAVFLTHGLTPTQRETLRSLWPYARYVNQLPLGPAPAERFWPLDETRVIVFTSGSSGEPSAVPLSTSQLLLSAFGSAIRLGHNPDDRWLSCLPFHHVGGLSILFRCALYGTTVILHERFRADEVAKALDDGEATLVSLVPSMLTQVLDARPDRPFPETLRVVLLGGDAAPEPLLDRCRELEVPVALTWGMTETASQVATRAPGDLSLGSGCGAPLPFARVESRAGVLSVRGPLAAGELPTRDLGHLDASGRVHVEGRREGFVVSGGETVSLTEIETLLRIHPDLDDAAVVGRPDARWGERPVAWIVPRKGSELSDDALRSWCEARLSRFKVPARFERCEALPRTDLGKLARGELRRLTLERDPHRDPSAPQAREPQAPEAESSPNPLHTPILAALVGAAERNGAEGLRRRLDEVGGIVAGDLSRLEEELQSLAARFEAGPQTASKHAARDLLGRAGKRLRPLCALLAARLGQRPRSEAARCVAIASELIHTATLLHDDVIDEANERRGMPAARVVYGNSASVLAGDFLFAEALRIVGETGETVLLDQLLSVIAEMVEAEALQLERRAKLDPTRETYLRVCAGKTAALFRWSLSAGGAVAGLSHTEVGALARAGEALGLAFQLVDDVLDLDGDPVETGKDALADLRQGKLTWPLILALERDPELLAHLESLLSEEEVSGPAGAAFLTRVADMGVGAETLAFARERAESARAELATLPETWSRELLEAIVDRVVDRSA